MAALGVAGLAISAVGLAIQLCEVGDKALNLTKIVSSNGRSNVKVTELTLLTSHECEQSKLLKAVLFDRGKFGLTGSLFEGMDERNQSLMFAILYQLSEAWLEFHAIVERLHTRMLGSGAPPDQIELHAFSGGPLPGDGSIAEQKRMEGDLDRLKAILSTTTIWNQRIERSVKTHLWLYSMDQDSPAMSIGRLEQVAEDSSAQRLGWVETAKLRQIVIAIGTLPANTTALPVPPSLKYHDNAVNLVGKLSDGLLSGLLGRSNVLVEFRAYAKSSADIPLDSFERRIEQLTALLHIPKDPAFRMPEALDFFHDPKKSRHGIIFDPQKAIPSGKAHAFSLHKLISESQKAGSRQEPWKRPSLGSRFGLAHALALALSKFQSISWVHQGIRSENIFFFDREPTPIQIRYREPWLFGYGNSRPDTSLSVNMYDENPIRNLYRHPDRWGLLPVTSFRKIHDIYSLGIVLLEIAFWKPIADLVKSESKNKGVVAEDVKKEILLLAKHDDVADLMGEAFSAILVSCLTGNVASFGLTEGQDTQDDSLLQAAFQKQVVDVLAKVLSSVM